MSLTAMAHGHPRLDNLDHPLLRKTRTMYKSDTIAGRKAILTGNHRMKWNGVQICIIGIFKKGGLLEWLLVLCMD